MPSSDMKAQDVEHQYGWSQIDTSAEAEQHPDHFA